MERKERLFKKEWAQAALVWSTFSVGTIVAALTGPRSDLDETGPDSYSYQPTREKKIDPPHHLRVWKDEVILRKLEQGETEVVQSTNSTEPMVEPAAEVKDPATLAMEVLNSHPQEFDDQDREDVAMYYHIYQAAAEKYDLNWYLLWIIHQAESTVSRDETAFESGRLHYGAMQRAVDYYSKEDVRAAAQGLEALATFPQRHYDDWEEIAWAASKLRADAQYAKSLGIDNSLLAALHTYSAAGPANYRYELYQKYQTIFEPQSQ